MKEHTHLHITTLHVHRWIEKNEGIDEVLITKEFTLFDNVHEYPIYLEIGGSRESISTRISPS